MKRVLAALFAISIATSFAARATAEEDAGTADAEARVDDDPWERGATAVVAPRPKALPVRACSLTRRICVHGPGGSQGAVLDTLRSAERAEAIVRGPLRLPAPDADVSTGALDVYLVDRDEPDARVRFGGRDLASSFDRASGFVELPRALSGCARDVAIERAVLRAVLLRVAPATSAAVAEASTTHLAGLGTACIGPRLDEIAAFQSSPTRGLVTADDDLAGRKFARGAASFFDWADVRFGAEPGGLVRASWSLVPTKTPAGAETFAYRPDLFDVLRKSFKEALSIGSSIDDLFLRFAGARASFGPQADATTLPASRAWGAAAKIAVDFAIDWPEAPRRFLSPQPVMPTGASYVLVRHKGARPGARLRLEAEWEEHARFRWMVLKLDPGGAALGSVLIASTPRATSAQATITELDGTDSVLVVAMNAGDESRPYDPDDGAFEPHAYLLTLASE
jgi:hypothetical protein